MKKLSFVILTIFCLAFGSLSHAYQTELNDNIINLGLINKNNKEQKPNINKVDERYLKINGIDAHKLKHAYLGKKASIAEYDIYIDKNTRELIIYRKGGTGEGIHTGEYIR
ncbi:polymorphic toxin type 33 domain-containing protein [Xenorhabdus sp. XENO-10]|uniref:Polymorphic toxin type 33 domain-containing protein n=1 Tax=Xenorhabdus yunnanensis TaxID=3025878 RepID=A0ABT5LJV9_9GAMM|nr:polymorphic toxin type 33 domain-containing protein [Xenorhabdus yunnanensis]MDC9591401.1 polymorphic toxin type 33 domain-containing protein [Xenorhabdus yunnanensis]